MNRTTTNLNSVQLRPSHLMSNQFAIKPYFEWFKGSSANNAYISRY